MNPDLSTQTIPERRNVSSSVAIETRIKELTTSGKTLFVRKNFEEAVPHFKAAFKLSKKAEDVVLRLSCLNNFIASLRMLGAAGCPEALLHIDTALDLAAKLSMKDVGSRVNAYLNAGCIHILRHEWLAAISVLNVAEDSVAGAEATEFRIKAKLVGMVTLCAAQARIGLLTSPNAEHHRDRHLAEIDLRLRNMLNLELHAELLATAHKSLALVAERIRRPPDLPAMARHRRAAWALMGLSPQGTCPICTEDIACDSPGAVTLGCFHIFHRPCWTRYEETTFAARQHLRCPLCRFSGFS